MFRKVKKKYRKHPDEKIKKPTRATSGSAGYDFYAVDKKILLPGKKYVFWTDIKAKLPKNTYLSIVIRSSLAIKHDLILMNQNGIIDEDYYNNPENDGNIAVCIKNVGNKDYTIEKGDRIAQGIINEYKKFDNVSKERKGGIGSTSNENK
jgi:dUTP pyrophosphatase